MNSPFLRETLGCHAEQPRPNGLKEVRQGHLGSRSRHSSPDVHKTVAQAVGLRDRSRDVCARWERNRDVETLTTVGANSLDKAVAGRLRRVKLTAWHPRVRGIGLSTFTAPLYFGTPQRLASFSLIMHNRR
jgi:hypothetical protein